jgi:hypothetical protein
MKIPRHHIGQPERQDELEYHFEKRITDLIIEATDAGYNADEMLLALKNVPNFKRIFHRCDTAHMEGASEV